MAGAEASDSDAADPPAKAFAEYAGEDPPRLRIAVVAKPTSPGVPLAKDRRAALDATARRLGELGHDVEVVKGAYPLLLPMFLPRYLLGIREDAAKRGHYELLEPRTRTALRVARLIPRALLRRSLRREAAFTTKVERQVFGDHDVLLTPTIPRGPQNATKAVGRGWLRTTYDANQYVAYTALWNLTGYPAASVPAGRDANGLPLAVQLVARPGREDLLYGLGGQLERAAGAVDSPSVPPGAAV
jgi:amidase